MREICTSGSTRGEGIVLCIASSPTLLVQVRGFLLSIGDEPQTSKTGLRYACSSLCNVDQNFQWMLKTRVSMFAAPAKSTFMCQSFVW